jgi:hypothetical protein
MSGFTFTGVTGGGRAGSGGAGSTRWNTDTNRFEYYDGYRWSVMASTERDITMLEMIQHLEDRLAVEIDEKHQGNVAIQDAYKVWEEANEHFKVILALAEKK